MELDFPPEYKKWRSCNPHELYNAPVQKLVPQVAFNSECAPLIPSFLRHYLATHRILGGGGGQLTFFQGALKLCFELLS
jgi:hypothetical protein